MGLLVLVVPLERHFHLSEILGEARIQERLLAAGPLAPLVFILVMAATVVADADVKLAPTSPDLAFPVFPFAAFLSH